LRLLSEEEGWGLGFLLLDLSVFVKPGGLRGGQVVGTCSWAWAFSFREPLNMGPKERCSVVMVLLGELSLLSQRRTLVCLTLSESHCPLPLSRGWNLASRSGSSRLLLPVSPVDVSLFRRICFPRVCYEEEASAPRD
jgi:hypothetical protein